MIDAVSLSSLVGAAVETGVIGKEKAVAAASDWFADDDPPLRCCATRTVEDNELNGSEPHCRFLSTSLSLAAMLLSRPSSSVEPRLAKRFMILSTSRRMSWKVLMRTSKCQDTVETCGQTDERTVKMLLKYCDDDDVAAAAGLLLITCFNAVHTSKVQEGQC